MAQHRFLLRATMVALLCILAGMAQAEYVYEAWRSHFETHRGASALSEGQ